MIAMKKHKGPLKRRPPHENGNLPAEWALYLVRFFVAVNFLEGEDV